VLHGGNVLEAVAGHHPVVMVRRDRENCRILRPLAPCGRANVVKRGHLVQGPANGNSNYSTSTFGVVVLAKITGYMGVADDTVWYEYTLVY
jgi:hypothetical protein